ncbi:methyl-accepting chemotaxis protein [Streptomyces sp. SAI-144]|nr:methyl-accepting chemotaxis protein [Streptomyces sp. SAI-144]
MPDRTGNRRRLGSIRLSLIMLALVPSVTLAAMWGVTTTQLFSEGLRLRSQTELSRSTGAMGTETTLALQGERAVSAAWLAKVPGSRAALDEKRAATDAAVAKLVQRSDEIQQAPARIADQLYSVLGSVGSLEYYRDQVDHPTDITAQQALGQYTSIIDDQIHAFQQLSQVDDGDLTSQAGPLVAIEHAAELTSQEDVALTLAWPSGQLDEKAWEQFVQLVNTRRWLVEDQIVPALSGTAKTQTERILASPDWRALTAVEDQVLAARPAAGTGQVALPDLRKRWAPAMDKVSVRYTALIREQTSGLLTRSADKAHDQLLTAASLSAGGLIALLLCLVMSWRITRSLSRRLRGLREATLSLAQERLPDVVARLDRGEKVDVDRAAPELDYGSDELGQVAKAFNAAQRTAVVTAVELADTRRGFQKVILGIARESQNLVNLQLSRLDTLEREHQDPDVLSGLYELDSTASQLRRYEENLVIISGGQPRRSWTEPVALIDILRSAVGEVAEYQRVEVHTEEEVCLAPPAVADVIHLLAELIENATLYSPAPRSRLGTGGAGRQGSCRRGRGPGAGHVGGRIRLLQRPLGRSSQVRRRRPRRRPPPGHVRHRPPRQPPRRPGDTAVLAVRRDDGDRVDPARDRRTGGGRAGAPGRSRRPSDFGGLGRCRGHDGFETCGEYARRRPNEGLRLRKSFGRYGAWGGCKGAGERSTRDGVRRVGRPGWCAGVGCRGRPGRASGSRRRGRPDQCLGTG